MCMSVHREIHKYNEHASTVRHIQHRPCKQTNKSPDFLSLYHPLTDMIHLNIDKANSSTVPSHCSWFRTYLPSHPPSWFWKAAPVLVNGGSNGESDSVLIWSAQHSGESTVYRRAEGEHFKC